MYAGAMSTVTSIGDLQHDIPAGARADRAVFDREGYSVSRRALEPELLREVRAPLIERLIADGSIEHEPGEVDRFRWIGDERPANVGRLAAEQVEELLFRSGAANRAVAAAWGRAPALSPRIDVYIMLPGDPVRVHRDGWQMVHSRGADEHFNFWVPLTHLEEGDGTLAVAIGSHQVPNEPPLVPIKHPMHLDVVAVDGELPLDEVLDPLWRTTRFDLGDALLFRPDIIHSTTPNDGPYLRIAFALRGWDNSQPYGIEAGLSLDAGRDLADVEWLTLGILAVQPSTPWLAYQAFSPRGVVGRLWACRPMGQVLRACETSRRGGSSDRTRPTIPSAARSTATTRRHHAAKLRPPGG